MSGEQEKPQPNEGSDAEMDAGAARRTAADRPTFEIGSIEGQIVNPGGEMTLGDVTLNAAFDQATMNVRSRLESAAEAASAVSHGEEQERQKMVQLIEALRAQLETLSQQHAEEALRVARRLDVLMEEVQEEEPDPEMVAISGQGLKRAAENLAGVLPAVVGIALDIVKQAGLLVR